MAGTKLYLIPVPGPRIFYVIILELLVHNFLRMIYLSFPIKYHILVSSDGICCYSPWEALWWILKHTLLHEPHFGINTSSDWLIQSWWFSSTRTPGFHNLSKVLGAGSGTRYALKRLHLISLHFWISVLLNFYNVLIYRYMSLLM